MFVLGIDPGLSRCGYGCVQRVRTPQAVAAGVICTEPNLGKPYRLAKIQREVKDLIAELQPDTVALERVLFQQNVRTAMSVGMVSGIVMAEAVAAGCEVVEYSPNEIKSAIAGWGGADKDQVGAMVQTLLGLPERLKPADVADAVAVALCHLANLPATLKQRSRVSI